MHSPSCSACDTPPLPLWQDIHLLDLTERVRVGGWRWASGPQGPCLVDGQGQRWDFSSRHGCLRIRPALSHYLEQLTP